MEHKIWNHYSWIKEIRQYINRTDDEVIRYSLAYTLQSLRNNENMNRFKWEECEWKNTQKKNSKN